MVKKKKGQEREAKKPDDTNPSPLRISDYRDVMDAFDRKQLAKRCNSAKAPLFREMDSIEGDVGDQYAISDRGSSILAVAHVDHVQTIKGWGRVLLDGEERIYSPRLDDRLGVYTILDLLPRLGIKLDVLLTDNEETGNSTAKLFETSKDYNWVVEFDRKGRGAVTYSFGMGGWNDTLEPYFGKPDRGSFSDICHLDFLGCKAVNVAVGYHDEHNKRAYMEVIEYFDQIARFLAFFRDNSETHFEHRQPVKVSNSQNWSASGYQSYRNSCALCKTVGGYSRKFISGAEFRAACRAASFVVNIPKLGEEGHICSWCLSRLDMRICWCCDRPKNKNTGFPSAKSGSSWLAATAKCKACTQRARERAGVRTLKHAEHKASEDTECASCRFSIEAGDKVYSFEGVEICEECAMSFDEVDHSH